MTSDSDLVRGAQTGDAVALGLLLERHRPALHARALRLVGHAEAHDAVQDAFVVAMRRIGLVREPDKIEGWLHVVLRNACLDRLRAQSDLVEAPEIRAPETDEPESVIDSLALRDWVWTAVGRLSEPLRLVTMLRHFSQCSAYEDIALVCDIPVGTVRSRLNEARRLLADDLLRTASHAHSEAAERTAAERARFQAAIDDVARTQTHDALMVGMTDDITFRFTDGQRYQGFETIRAGMSTDIEAGVGLRYLDAFASRDITIVEAAFINPPHDPDHCPPAMTWVQLHRDSGTYWCSVFHAPRV